MIRGITRQGPPKSATIWRASTSTTASTTAVSSASEVEGRGKWVRKAMAKIETSNKFSKCAINRFTLARTKSELRADGSKAASLSTTVIISETLIVSLQARNSQYRFRDLATGINS